MHRFLALIAFAVSLTVASSQSELAADTAALVLDGDLTKPMSWTLADLKRLPRITVKVKNDSGTEDLYEGVDLANLLTLGGVPLKGALKGGDVARYLHAEGQDGFAAVFALPEFDAGTFVVADSVNGQALPADRGPLQMISPQEMRHSRWVKQLNLLPIKRSVK